MKVILITLCLVCLTLAQSPELIECIEINCPDQYATCKKNANCEAKLRQGADNCGETVNELCWTKYVLFNIPAQNVCFCAVDAKCLASMNQFDQTAISLLKAVHDKLEELQQQ